MKEYKIWEWLVAFLLMVICFLAVLYFYFVRYDPGSRGSRQMLTFLLIVPAFGMYFLWGAIRAWWRKK